eukprot:m.346894 g.346894  ORF g.346894 m.346894 type:complete len:91 (+) comp30618_c0_seq1:54-326(+)
MLILSFQCYLIIDIIIAYSSVLLKQAVRLTESPSPSWLKLLVVLLLFLFRRARRQLRQGLLDTGGSGALSIISIAAVSENIICCEEDEEL